MGCLAIIWKLFLVGIVTLALFLAGVMLLAFLESAKQSGPATQSADTRSVDARSTNPSIAGDQVAESGPPPSLERRIELAQEALGSLKLRAKEALESVVVSKEPDAALRQVVLSFETIADGSGGANKLAKQLSEETTQIRNTMQSVRANSHLSKNDKNDLLKTLAAQELSVRKTLGQAQEFCDELRSIQTNEIPSWTLAYSHFVTVLGASEAHKRIAPRIEAAASKLGAAK